MENLPEHALVAMLASARKRCRMGGGGQCAGQHIAHHLPSYNFSLYLPYSRPCHDNSSFSSCKALGRLSCFGFSCWKDSSKNSCYWLYTRPLY